MNTIFIGIGIILVLLGAVMFMLSKRKNKVVKQTEAEATEPKQTITAIIVDENTLKANVVEGTLIGNQLTIKKPYIKMEISELHLINDKIYILQKSKTEFIPLLLRSGLVKNKYKMELIDKLRNNAPLTDKDKNELKKFINSDKLTPYLDPSYLIVYANNVQRLLELQAQAKDTIFDRLAKWSPVIIIVFVAVAIVAVLYGYYSGLSSLAHIFMSNSTLNVTCSLPTTTTTTIAPPAFHLIP
ncbi:MAG: hypothetical protein QW478_07760 [Candidatus Micrarchaeaceae archaeon]